MITTENEKKKIIDNWFKIILKKKQDNDQFQNYPEVTDDKLKEAIELFFNTGEGLDEAKNKFNDYIDNVFTKDTYNDIDFENEEYRESPEYKQWMYHDDLTREVRLLFWPYNKEYVWTSIHGTKRTADEACEFAANVWMKMIFNYNIKDNGALDEKPSFMASLLSSTVGNEAKEKISEEVKQKVFELLKGYYKAALLRDRDWCKDNLPDNNEKVEYRLDWNTCYFEAQLDTDYHPCTPLRLILENGGVDKNDIDWICPWKTHIYVRESDYAVVVANSGNGKREIY